MIRRAQSADIPQLLALMRKLAAFEGYADRFCVTEQALKDRGFCVDRPAEFIAWIAEDNNVLVGYAVAYIIPFTFDLQPTVVLKELFVEQQARGKQHGSQLFAAVTQYAADINARLIRWQVIPSNLAAQRFYTASGGRREHEWEHWVLDLNSGLGR